MGKAKRLRGERKRARQQLGAGFLVELSARLTENFQREVRHSELWDQMVAEFGEARAEEILRECKAEVRPGVPDGSGHRPTDLS
jgi:hypothetical protein